MKNIRNKIREICKKLTDPFGHRALREHRALLRDVEIQIHYWHAEEIRAWELTKAAYKRDDSRALTKFWNQKETARLRAERELKRLEVLHPTNPRKHPSKTNHSWERTPTETNSRQQGKSERSGDFPRR